MGGGKGGKKPNFLLNWSPTMGLWFFASSASFASFIPSRVYSLPYTPYSYKDKGTHFSSSQ